jgi:branched-chain amino acid transport system permease protein
MPDGVLPALGSLVNRFRPKAASIREESAAELLERTEQQPRQAQEVTR